MEHENVYLKNYIQICLKKYTTNHFAGKSICRVIIDNTLNSVRIYQ